jgi:aldose 1-epimerase
MEDRDGDAGAGVISRPWGRLPDGREAMLFELRNGRGMMVCVCNYGGVVQSIRVPDRDGRAADVVLGFDALDGYLADDLYVGASIGRYANRIRGGRFVLDGREYHLPVNNGPNHLHGGPAGFHKVLWDAEMVADETAVRLTHVSPDGDQGYPGRLAAEVTFRLGDGGSLEIGFAATTDAPTLVNLTHHTYFNLAGDPTRDVLDHVVAIGADRFTPVDETQIPTGELRPVAGTPFDFRAPTPLGARVDADDAQLALGGGYDHNFVLR